MEHNDSSVAVYQFNMMLISCVGRSSRFLPHMSQLVEEEEEDGGGQRCLGTRGRGGCAFIANELVSFSFHTPTN